MNLRRFDCPKCNKFLGRSDGTRLETKCRTCREIVTAIPLELQLTLECTRCGRRHYYETPTHRPTYCVVCGIDSLQSIKRPVEVPVPVMRGG